MHFIESFEGFENEQTINTTFTRLLTIICQNISSSKGGRLNWFAKQNDGRSYMLAGEEVIMLDVPIKRLHLENKVNISLNINIIVDTHKIVIST